jgi:hypothetical protein
VNLLERAEELSVLGFPWAVLMLLVLGVAWLGWRSGRVWVERAWVWGFIAAVGCGLTTFLVEFLVRGPQSVLFVALPPLAFALTTTAILLVGVLRSRRARAAPLTRPRAGGARSG